MKIKRKNQIKKIKVSDLNSMHIYLILDSDDNESILFINHDKGHCFTIQNYSNSPDGVCCLHVPNNREVRVIGRIIDMTLGDIELAEVQKR
jgi:hypothetical protein